MQIIQNLKKYRRFKDSFDSDENMRLTFNGYNQGFSKLNQTSLSFS
jgi:hypothetical protein